MTSTVRLLAQVVFIGALLAAVTNAWAAYSLTVSTGDGVVVYGGDTDTVTATVMDDGKPLPGHAVQFSVSGLADPGSVDPTCVVTDALGKATTTYTSGANGGEVTITAKDLSQPGQPTSDGSGTPSKAISFEIWDSQP